MNWFSDSELLINCKYCKAEEKVKRIDRFMQLKNLNAAIRKAACTFCLLQSAGCFLRQRGQQGFGKQRLCGGEFFGGCHHGGHGVSFQQ